MAPNAVAEYGKGGHGVESAAERRGHKAPADSAHRLRGVDQAEVGAAAVQHGANERRKQGAHDPLPDRDDRQEDEQRPQNGFARRQSQAVRPLVAQFPDAARRPWSSPSRRVPDARPAATTGSSEQNAAAIRKLARSAITTGTRPPAATRTPPERRAEQSGRVAVLAVERVDGRQLRGIGDQRQHLLLGGSKELLDGALPRHHDVDHPHVARVSDEQQRQQTACERQIGDDHGPLRVPPVDEHSGERAQRDLWDERRKQHRGRRDRRPGERVDVVGKPDTQHPVARQRDEPGAEQQAHPRLCERGRVAWPRQFPSAVDLRGTTISVNSTGTEPSGREAMSSSGRCSAYSASRASMASVSWMASCSVRYSVLRPTPVWLRQPSDHSPRSLVPFDQVLDRSLRRDLLEHGQRCRAAGSLFDPLRAVGRVDDAPWALARVGALHLLDEAVLGELAQMM